MACDMVKHTDISSQKNENNITTAFLEWLYKGDPITTVSFIIFNFFILICYNKSQHCTPCICIQVPSH